ncbi:MAG: hypothetical protein ACRECR_07125 [Thermoplasmata archaeon]
MSRAHRILRISGVLIASQLRSSRAGSDPNSFSGKAASLLVYDAGAFLLAFLAVRTLLDSPDAAALSGSPGFLLPLIPAFALGAVLVAGVLFELSSNSRFSSSDAINWMPVLPEEYVLASALAIAYSYALALALALGAGLAVALSLGNIGAFALAAGLGAVGLLLGGLILEMLRAVTQHAAAAMSGRAGGVTLALRAATIIIVGLVFVLLFNPVLFLAIVRSAGTLDTVATYVPFLWGTRALAAGLAGQWAIAGFFAGAELGVVFLLGYAAAELRARYWYPEPTEIRLEAHAYGLGHPLLRAAGFRPEEASVVSKDLRGLVRRREMAPLLIMPIVFGLVGLLGLDGSGSGTLGNFTTELWVAWVSGFFGLLLATTCIGQERQGFQNLYSAPLSARSVFRAKAGSVVLLAGIYAIASTATMSLRFGLGPAIALGVGLVALVAALQGTFIGLSFAARYSDFQDRPRPQYLRLSAMMGAMALGFVLIVGTTSPLAYWLARPGFSGPTLGLLVGGGVAAAVVVATSFLVARSGIDRLLLEMPF